MNIAEFFQKYRGKYVDGDGVYGPQCVDLIKAYFIEVLGYPAYKGNAIDYWHDIPGFTRIKKSIFKWPKPGDIVIWGPTASNIYGHVSIVNWSRWFDVGVFEQNFPTGAPCQFRDAFFDGALGWLRPNYPPEGWLGGNKRPEPAPKKPAMFTAYLFGPDTREINEAVEYVNNKLMEFSGDKLGLSVAGRTVMEPTAPAKMLLPDSEIVKLLNGFSEKTKSIIIFYRYNMTRPWASTQYIAGCPDVPIIKLPIPWPGGMNSTLLFEVGHALIGFYNNNRGGRSSISNVDNYSGGENIVFDKVQKLLPYLDVFK